MNIKDDFPILQNRKIAYLDSGATTQKPKQVLDGICKFYNTANANPHRGAYKLSIEATNVYDEARKKVANFINAKNVEEVIFTKNASEALNLIAYTYGLQNVEKDDEIVISIMEHHSNLVPWQKVARDKNAKLNYMYINENYELTEEEIRSKITKNTKVVAITHVSNVLGTVNDVKHIAQIAHENGAVVVVDASQSIPHMKIDVQDIDADFLVFSGHKMLAPLGIGVLYGKKELLESMPPFLMGGDMIEYVYEQETTYAELPKKFEAGTQNVAGSVGLAYAIDYLNSIGMENVAKREKELVSYAKRELAKLDFVETYYTSNEKNHSSVISFNVKGVHPHDVATILDSCGVAIRAGDHCAQPLVRFLNLPATCRASFYIYNTEADVDKLIYALNKVFDKFAKYM
jgi:cysteine desulfurase/selenocysteine lyase